MDAKRPEVLIAACAAALAAESAVLGGAPSGGAGLVDIVALLIVAFAAHAIALSPALLLARASPRAAWIAILVASMFIGGVPTARWGAAVNTPHSHIALETLVGLSLTAIAGALAIETRIRAAVIASLAAVVIAFSLGRAALPARSAHGAGPDVVLITIDTLRADHVDYAAGGNTPALAALAAAGARFDQAIAGSPLTGPSHTTILTGRSAITTGVVANGTPIGSHPEALAAVMGDAGWRTGAFVGGFPVHRRFGFDGGFDVYDSDFAAMHGLHDVPVIQLVDQLVPSAMPRERRADAVVDRAVAWLDARDDAPVMLWVHLYDPHAPYDPPDPYASRAGTPRADGPPMALPAWWPRALRDVRDPDWLAARYAAEISWTDSQVARVVQAVDRRGRPTVIAVTSDHGEALGEHGVWFDHGDDLYDPALRVPLIVRAPGVAPGTRITAQVPSVDLTPTLLDLAGVHDAFARDGRSRAADLRGVPGVDDDALATTLGARHADPPVDHALRRPDGKCYARFDRPPVYLDLRADPSESAPAIGGSDAAALCGDLARRLVGATALPAGSDDATLEQLEALGYIEPR